MTRILVQRGVVPSSNLSQKRECSSSVSSSASSLPHPSQPEASLAPGQVFGSALGEEESEQVIEQQSHRDVRNLKVLDAESRFPVCNLESKVHDREDLSFVGTNVDNAQSSYLSSEILGRWHEPELATGLSAYRVPAEKKEVDVTQIGVCEEVERSTYPSDEEERALWPAANLMHHTQDVDSSSHDSKVGMDHIVNRIGASAVHSLGQSLQTGILSTSASCHQDPVFNNCSVQQSLLEVEPMAHIPFSTPQVIGGNQFPSIEPSAGLFVPLGNADVDADRIDCSQLVTESIGCSYVLGPAPPIPSLSCSMKSTSSTRRGGWMGPASSGVRSSGPPRRLPKAMTSARISPSSSRPSSPRSFSEGDGYNSADEQVTWSSGPSAYADDAEREKQFEVDLLRLRNWHVKRMAEDGNCLFRAVSDQVYGDTEMYDETRQMSIDYMEKERDHFSSFVTESFTAYCKRKRRDKVYGNNLEIQAMAEMYNRPIHIYSYSTEPINIFHGSYETDLPPMRLSYHRNNHYNSLVDPCKPAVGAGLGFGSLRGRNVDREQVKAAIKAQQEQQIDKALLAEGRYYSDLELTEQEIERMVMEASRAEYLAAESQRHQFPCNETSTSTSAMPSSSRTIGSPRGSSTVVQDFQASEIRHTSRAVSPSMMTSAVLSRNVRMLLSMGFSYLHVMEACSIFSDDVNNMLCYLLEAEACGAGDEGVYRMKGKAAEG